MAKDPAFLFYPNDWIGGTMGMTFEEKGAYMELLMMQFNRGHMTKHMIGQTVGQLWDNIKDKFEVDSNGLYFNERLEEEQSKRKKYTESRRNNKKGSNQYSKKPQKKVGHMTSHMENENINSINKVSFEIFWNLYDNKRNETQCRIYWEDVITSDESVKIIETLPAFKNSIDEKRFMPYPITYLRDERWKDVIKKDTREYSRIAL